MNEAGIGDAAADVGTNSITVGTIGVGVDVGIEVDVDVEVDVCVRLATEVDLVGWIGVVANVAVVLMTVTRPSSSSSSLSFSEVWCE